MDRNNNKNEYLNIQSNVYCKDQIWVLIPKGEWTLAQRVQNNEFVENRLEKLDFNKSNKR